MERKADKWCACGHRLPDNAMFCSRCGRPITATKSFRLASGNQRRETAPKSEQTDETVSSSSGARLRDAVLRSAPLFVLLLLVFYWFHRPITWLFVISGTLFFISLVGRIAVVRNPPAVAEKAAETKSGLSTIAAISVLLVVASGPWWQTTLAHQEVPGEVLIAGGTNGKEILDTAELYDPVTGVFAATGTMTSARVDAVAVLLNGGKVLVVGGASVGLDDPRWAPLAAAELFDPHSGRFAATGDMNHARTGATATSLSDGRVLVVGGAGEHGTEIHAELYDPASASFQEAGSTTEPREGHRATLLQNGTVLIVGGTGNAAASAEVYDPNSGTFTPAGDIIARCEVNSATALTNGQVLLTGNDTRWIESKQVGVQVACAELYDPTSRTFSPIKDRPSVCGIFNTIGLKGSVLLTGGSNDCNLNHLGGVSADLYSPPSRSFQPTGEMNVPRSESELTLLADGRVLVTGGVSGEIDPKSSHPVTPSDTAEIYDPATHKFTLTGDMTGPRVEHMAVLFQNPQGSRQP